MGFRLWGHSISLTEETVIKAVSNSAKENWQAEESASDLS